MSPFSYIISNPQGMDVLVPFIHMHNDAIIFKHTSVIRQHARHVGVIHCIYIQLSGLLAFS